MDKKRRVSSDPNAKGWSDPEWEKAFEITFARHREALEALAKL